MLAYACVQAGAAPKGACSKEVIPMSDEKRPERSNRKGSRPGGSGNSHASNSSYGFPGRFDLRFTVVAADSSGIYAGAWGDGTETMDVDGGSGVWHLDGVVHR